MNALELKEGYFKDINKWIFWISLKYRGGVITFTPNDIVSRHVMTRIIEPTS